MATASEPAQQHLDGVGTVQMHHQAPPPGKEGAAAGIPMGMYQLDTLKRCAGL
jgi:hypothetical protein